MFYAWQSDGIGVFLFGVVSGDDLVRTGRYMGIRIPLFGSSRIMLVHPVSAMKAPHRVVLSPPQGARSGTWVAHLLEETKNGDQEAPK